MTRIPIRPPARLTRKNHGTLGAIGTAGLLLIGAFPAATSAAVAEIAASEPAIAEAGARPLRRLALDTAGGLLKPSRVPELVSLTAPSLRALPSNSARAAAARGGSSWPSGLPWRSGASCGHPAFEAWRGRKLDVQVQFVWHDSWDQMAARLNSSYFRTTLSWTPQPIVSLAMLPGSARQQHAACAKGTFDGYFRQFGQILTATGAKPRPF